MKKAHIKRIASFLSLVLLLCLPGRVPADTPQKEEEGGFVQEKVNVYESVEPQQLPSETVVVSPNRDVVVSGGGVEVQEEKVPLKSSDVVLQNKEKDILLPGSKTELAQDLVVTTPLLGVDGKPIIGIDGKPLMVERRALLGKDGKPIIGTDGKPLMAERRALLGKDGKPIIGKDGKPVMVEATPLLDKNGKPVIGRDGKPLTVERGVLLGKDGKPIIGKDGKPVMVEAKPLLDKNGKPVVGKDGKPVMVEARPLLDKDGKPVIGKDGKPVMVEAKPLLDKDGKPVIGKDGKPVMVEAKPLLDKNGKPVIGKDGKPVMAQTKPLLEKDRKPITAETRPIVTNGPQPTVVAENVPYVPYFGEPLPIDRTPLAKEGGAKKAAQKQAQLKEPKEARQQPSKAAPETQAKKPKKGQKLEIPEKAAQNRDLAFLEGCWATDDDPLLLEWGTEKTVPAHRTFCFDRNGRGTRENLTQGRRYIGSASARFVNGRLYIEAGRSQSPDGLLITPSTLKCEGTGSKTICRKTVANPSNPKELRHTVHSLYRK